ncbi:MULTISPECIES: hypothetical protein [unclassified Curtobacterium]|uniref:hypothetical protein n=1 Tax=unclassified Curtobacterium TaxID=257496 RepID=UPI000FB2A967|nr:MULTISPECIES: hypothetical protein [unclassified Curtobacterium]ROQ18727.1 hypothetical protein EDF41_0049 [Curtobacterium sp. PhB171]ROQ18993.1 hypothetical protein EDF40_3792 [Curtobacterium sp. PhB170]ROS32463.1 hypothetical protein EDF25_3635 [Curtobacterium sp. PhB131]ROS74221.1 hypothetical protein EDF30_0111 [Curtobacterium sp. PhB141]
MRSRLVIGLLVALACTVPLTACSAAEGLARNALGSSGGSSGTETAVCPSAEAPAPDAANATPDPTPAPTLDPAVASQVRTALRQVRALPAVAEATQTTTNTPSSAADPTCSTRWVTSNHFASRFTVAMDPDATPAQAGAVPTTMATELAWTGASLTLTVPADEGHIASTVHYDGTFDQQIPTSTSTAVAQGLATLAATPHVTGLEASIPYTMRVDYGSLVIGVDSEDQGVLDRVRAVIDTTAFADTTLHGSFGNGAKP